MNIHENASIDTKTYCDKERNVQGKDVDAETWKCTVELKHQADPVHFVVDVVSFSRLLLLVLIK